MIDLYTGRIECYFQAKICPINSPAELLQNL